MIRPLAIILGAFALAGPASASILIYTGAFSGANESPPSGSLGTGFTTVTIDTTLFTMRTEANFTGLGTGTTAAHIHIRPDSQTANGGVATQLPSFVNFPLGVTSGTYDQTFDMTLASSWNPTYVTNNGGTTASAFSAFVSSLNSGLGYFNIHTTGFPGGEIRANLAPVPEPATILVLSLGAAALVRRRKRAAK
jgi:hypothetical protein